MLLPTTPEFDLAVNVFTYQPGAALPQVEIHVMEHGLLMLDGQGVYRLGDDWYPVKKDDVIWMAPYCPQWFVAMGKSPVALSLLQRRQPRSVVLTLLPDVAEFVRIRAERTPSLARQALMNTSLTASEGVRSG